MKRYNEMGRAPSPQCPVNLISTSFSEQNNLSSRGRQPYKNLITSLFNTLGINEVMRLLQGTFLGY